MKEQNSLFYKILTTNFVNVNLLKRKISINKHIYFQNLDVFFDGDLIRSTDLMEYGIDNCFKDPWGTASKLYQIYKHSIPDANYKMTFKALTFDKLSDDDLVNGMNRFKAKNILEGYLLLMSYLKILVWENDSCWFWQDENDKDFVILKKYLFN